MRVRCAARARADRRGVPGSENYHTARYDKSGSNANYHPRDSTSGDADAMEPAWWRPGPGANSEYTGHAMDGEIYDPPDVKVRRSTLASTHLNHAPPLRVGARRVASAKTARSRRF